MKRFLSDQHTNLRNRCIFAWGCVSSSLNVSMSRVSVPTNSSRSFSWTVRSVWGTSVIPYSSIMWMDTYLCRISSMSRFIESYKSVMITDSVYKISNSTWFIDITAQCLQVFKLDVVRELKLCSIVGWVLMEALYSFFRIFDNLELCSLNYNLQER